MPAEEDLGWDRTFLSSGGSIILIFMTLISPLAGNLLDRIGPRPVVVGALFVSVSIAWTSLMTQPWQFILLFCVIGGLGYGSLAALASATIAQLFDEHRYWRQALRLGRFRRPSFDDALLALLVEWAGYALRLLALEFS